MKKILFLLVSLSLLLLTACSLPDAFTSLSQEKAWKLYEEAVKEVGERETLCQNADFSINGITYTLMTDYDRTSNRISVWRTYSGESEDCEISQVFDNGTGYYRVNDMAYQSGTDTESFVPFPLIPLSDISQDRITGKRVKGGYLLTVSGEKDDISAQIRIDKKGKLTGMDCSSYLPGCACTVSYADGQTVSLPDSPETYKAVSSAGAMADYAAAVFIVKHSGNLRLRQNYTVNCPAGGVNRTQTTNIQKQANENGGLKFAQAELNAQINDYAQSGVLTQLYQKEIFSGGAYTVQINGGEITADPKVTEEVMANYLSELVGCHFGEICDCSATEADGCLILDPVPKENRDVEIRTIASNVLYSDPDVLSAGQFVTKQLTVNMKIDKKTMSPLSYEYAYDCTHTVSGHSYDFSVRYSSEYTYE